MDKKQFMNEKISEYLTKKATLTPWSLETHLNKEIEQVVVIPAYNEFAGILTLFQSLSMNPIQLCEKTLVIVVVNNQNETISPPEALKNNQETIEFLKTCMYSNQTPFPIGIIDASSAGYEFPVGQGVGLARKIGLDWGLRYLAEEGNSFGGLICLDADCTVSDNYLFTWNSFFKENPNSAGVMYSEHPIEHTPLGLCMLAYEIYLRTYELGLCYAQSPYTFLPIGSTIGVPAVLYAASGGMSTRIAGEDFYFLQQLARISGIKRITEATVFPSSRLSERVPFGTGAKLKQYMNQPEKRFSFYPFSAFEILRRWIQCLDHPDENAEYMLLQAETIHPELAHFLSSNYWLQKTSKIFKQHKNRSRLIYHLHEWFDGLKTLRLLNHLKEFAFVETTVFETLKEFVVRLNMSEFEHINFESIQYEYNQQHVLLNTLRKSWDKLKIAGINYHLNSN
ncbi:MAG: glycosyltransferase family 2 protein [Candidatus Hydrogenedens sp.]|nr:glycosyltransferase family 2 protein [Candidatus Hydrogenedens sp.]